MESIILNLLNLTGEERAAFAVLAPQPVPPRRGRTDGGGLAVRPGNSGQPAAGVPGGEHRPALAPHPQCRGGPLYRPRRPALGGGADLLHRGLWPFGVRTPVRTAAGADEAPAPVTGTSRTGRFGGTWALSRLCWALRCWWWAARDLGSSFARLCQTLGARTSGVRRDRPSPPRASSACTASKRWTRYSPRRMWWPSRCLKPPHRPSL